MNAPCKYGTHRVLKPKGVLPQAADVIDNTMTIHANEMLIDVNTLNIDSASFHQIKNACKCDVETMKAMILDIVNTRGKMQNPVTGSGGMLIGTVKEIGDGFTNKNVKVGDDIATLVSLSLTPLKINAIKAINLDNDQVDVDAEAILFDSGIFAVLPDDMDKKLALAALDVAGAPAQVEKLAHPGDTVLIIGAAGKSGLLCAYQARQNVGPKGRVIGLVNEPWQVDLLDELRLVDEVLLMDATDAVAVHRAVAKATENKLADLTVNVVNVDNTEMASVLATKDEGTVYFFSMATSFTKAALGAEGVGKDVAMIIGNGYTKNHAEITLNILRQNEALCNLFEKKYT